MIELIPSFMPAVHTAMLSKIEPLLKRQLLAKDINVSESRKLAMILQNMIYATDVDTWGGQDDIVLSHIPLQMFVMTSKSIILEVVQRFDVRYLGSDDHLGDFEFGVFTGSLLGWKRGILEHCTHESTYFLRLFANKVHHIFDVMGLGYLLGNHNKDVLPDNTFVVRLSK